MSNLQLTTAGLPNSCSKCGKGSLKTWYATSEAQAKAGQGVCVECAFPDVKINIKAPAETEAPVQTVQAPVTAPVEPPATELPQAPDESVEAPAQATKTPGRKKNQ